MRPLHACCSAPGSTRGELRFRAVPQRPLPASRPDTVRAPATRRVCGSKRTLPKITLGTSLIFAKPSCAAGASCRSGAALPPTGSAHRMHARRTNRDRRGISRDSAAERLHLGARFGREEVRFGIDAVDGRAAQFEELRRVHRTDRRDRQRGPMCAPGARSAHRPRSKRSARSNRASIRRCARASSGNPSPSADSLRPRRPARRGPATAFAKMSLLVRPQSVFRYSTAIRLKPSSFTA